MLQLFYPEKQHLAELAAFIAQDESSCVTLASRMVKNGQLKLPSQGTRAFFALKKKDEICALFHFSTSGVLLHALRLPSFTLEELLEAGKLITPLISGEKLRCIMGEQAASLFLEGLESRKPACAKDFQLMTVQQPPTVEQCALPAAPPGVAGFTLCQVGQKAAQALLPLQRGYEIEEVLPPGERFDSEACLRALKVNLGEQFIVALRCGDQFIAKAGTNARGLEWDQIGGVFTLSEWRRRGLATALVASIARSRMLKGRKIALFVNNSNSTARHAYERAGFISVGHFRISYF